MRSETARGVLLVVAIFLLPFNVEIQLAEYGGYSDLQHRVSLFLFDVPLVLLAVLVAISLPRTRTSGPVDTFLLGMAALLVLTAIAVVVHPSARGIQVVVRLVVNLAAPAIAWATLSARWQRRALAVFVGAAVLQTVVGVAQVVRGETLGLTFLGENPPLLSFGDRLSAKGTFVHPYMLAAFALLAAGLAIAAYLDRRERTWLPVVAVCAVPIGLTYSRMSVLAVAGMVVVLLYAWFRYRRWTMPALVALLLGLGIPALLTVDAWIGKASPVEAETGVDAITNYRGTFTSQAVDLMREEPLVGVGPGLYVIALEERLELEGEVFPVHAVPLLVAAETGVLAGVLVAAGLVWLGWVAFAAGTARGVLYLAFLPFHLLDHFPYDNFQGLTMTGLWVGAVLVERRRT